MKNPILVIFGILLAGLIAFTAIFRSFNDIFEILNYFDAIARTDIFLQNSLIIAIISSIILLFSMGILIMVRTGNIIDVFASRPLSKRLSHLTFENVILGLTGTSLIFALIGFILWVSGDPSRAPRSDQQLVVLHHKSLGLSSSQIKTMSDDVFEGPLDQEMNGGFKFDLQERNYTNDLISDIAREIDDGASQIIIVDGDRDSLSAKNLVYMEQQQNVIFYIVADKRSSETNAQNVFWLTTTPNEVFRPVLNYFVSESTGNVLALLPTKNDGAARSVNEGGADSYRQLIGLLKLLSNVNVTKANLKDGRFEPRCFRMVIAPSLEAATRYNNLGSCGFLPDLIVPYQAVRRMPQLTQYQRVISTVPMILGDENLVADERLSGLVYALASIRDGWHRAGIVKGQEMTPSQRRKAILLAMAASPFAIDQNYGTMSTTSANRQIVPTRLLIDIDR